MADKEATLTGRYSDALQIENSADLTDKQSAELVSRLYGKCVRCDILYIMVVVCVLLLHA